MFLKLVSRNPDLARLVDRGYALAFDEANYLVVRDIPYLDAEGHLQWGAFVTKLIFIDEERVQQDDHQVFFAGSSPYDLTGSPIANLWDRNATLPLSADSADVVVQRQFSNKPIVSGSPAPFPDFFAKIESYVTVIAGPAMEKYGVHPYTRRIVESRAEPSVFKFRDIMTSRAEITDLAALFKDDVIAVIGLGGTGAYILDFMVKTPVREIRAFDADFYHVHNAFRSPGRLDPQEFSKPKSEVYRARYENFRYGLKCEPRYIDANSADDLAGVTFAFVCVDKGSARAAIFDLLIPLGIPFIDVGMGPKRKALGLAGMVRTSFVDVGDPTDLRNSGRIEMADASDNLYRTNIQIGELNALNACLAVIRFKQLRGYYVDEKSYFHMLMGIGDLKLIAETTADAT